MTRTGIRILHFWRWNITTCSNSPRSWCSVSLHTCIFPNCQHHAATSSSLWQIWQFPIVPLQRAHIQPTDVTEVSFWTICLPTLTAGITAMYCMYCIWLYSVVAKKITRQVMEVTKRWHNAEFPLLCGFQEWKRMWSYVIFKLSLSFSAHKQNSHSLTVESCTNVDSVASPPDICRMWKQKIIELLYVKQNCAFSDNCKWGFGVSFYTIKQQTLLPPTNRSSLYILSPYSLTSGLFQLTVLLLVASHILTVL